VLLTIPVSRRTTCQCAFPYNFTYLRLQAVTDALQALSAAVPPGDFTDHLEFMRSCISSTASSARHRVGPEKLLPNAAGELILPLFTVPKSLDPLYNILLHALMNGETSVAKLCVVTVASAYHVAVARCGACVWLTPYGVVYPVGTGGSVVYGEPKTTSIMLCFSSGCVIFLYVTYVTGSHTAREIAADTIGELALFADVAVLKPLLIKTTGPLIRVVGDRFPSSVKGAILQVGVYFLQL
jgi:hypothetical protein